MSCKGWWWRGGGNLTGTSGRDWLIGGRGDNTIDGLGGNDFIWGGRGDNIIAGGDGHDRIYAGRGHDRIDAGAGDDYIRAGRGDDHIRGGDGNDHIRGGRGHDNLSGGAGDDRVYADRGDDTGIYSVSSNHASRDFYHGGRGNDVLILQMTSAEHAAAKADLEAFDTYLAQPGNGWRHQAFQFKSFDLQVKGWERYEVQLTGSDEARTNVDPKAMDDRVSMDADAMSIKEHESNDPNGSSLVSTAQVIERSSFRIAPSEDVGDESLPRVSIMGAIAEPLIDGVVPNTNDVDVYAITLQAGENLVLDIDYGFEVGIDPTTNDPLISWLFVLDENGNKVGESVGGSAPTTGGAGSSSLRDPYLVFDDGGSGGTYYVAVSSFGNEPGSVPATFTDGGMLSGDYVLNVSIENPASDLGAFIINPDNLLINDSDKNGDDLNVIDVGNAVNGKVELTSAGEILFKPGTSSPGSFDYTVSDGNGGESTATVTVYGNTVSGTPSDDVLTGTSEADLFVGGDGSDTFNFATGSGNDAVADFEVGSDALAITDTMRVAGSEALNNDTLVNFDTGDSVLLVGVSGVTDVNDLLA